MAGDPLPAPEEEEEEEPAAEKRYPDSTDLAACTVADSAKAGALSDAAGQVGRGVPKAN